MDIEIITVITLVSGFGGIFGMGLIAMLKRLA